MAKPKNAVAITFVRRKVERGAMFAACHGGWYVKIGGREVGAVYPALDGPTVTGWYVVIWSNEVHPGNPPVDTSMSPVATAAMAQDYAREWIKGYMREVRAKGEA